MGGMDRARTSARVARERLGERESAGGSDGREIASEIGGVAVEGRRRGGGRESDRGGLHRARVGRGPHPERVARRAGATRGGRGRIRRSGRGGPVVQRAEFLRAVRHGRQDSRLGRLGPSESTGTSVGAGGCVAERDEGMMSPRMPLAVRKELRRGGRRGQHLPPRSRALVHRADASAGPDRSRARAVGGAASTARASSVEQSCVVAPARGAGLVFRSADSIITPRTETAGREALIEFSDAPGRLESDDAMSGERVVARGRRSDARG